MQVERGVEGVLEVLNTLRLDSPGEFTCNSPMWYLLLGGGLTQAVNAEFV